MNKSNQRLSHLDLVACRFFGRMSEAVFLLDKMQGHGFLPDVLGSVLSW